MTTSRSDITMFHPKGAMCMNCSNYDDSCHLLPFATVQTMQVYQQNGERIAVVKCDSFNLVNY